MFFWGSYRPFLSRKGMYMAIKKQWYEIIAPRMFGEKVVGETMAVDPKSLIGRKIQVSLMELSRNYSQFYIKLDLKVERVEGNRAFTVFMGHDIMRERVYRMVQRHGRRVDVVQDVTTKDGVHMRMKTVFMLIRRVGTSTKNSARTMAREAISEISKEKNFEDLMDMIIKGELQMQLKRHCSKVYPVGSMEIRKTELQPEKNVAA
jgi:small subunit ribosomal protein S3Ae